jgi:hypothetical protein
MSQTGHRVPAQHTAAKLSDAFSKIIATDSYAGSTSIAGPGHNRVFAEAS